MAELPAEPAEGDESAPAGDLPADEQEPSTGANSSTKPTLARRGLFGLAGGGALTLAAGAGYLGGRRGLAEASPVVAAHAFEGDHQAGIVTPAQDRMHFAAFDVTTSDRAELIDLLRRWTAAARQMTAGEQLGDGPDAYEAPPVDTGETIGLPPARLTITFGFGPSLFVDAAGAVRFGLDRGRPKALQRLPHFPADKLDPARSDGDLCVQACADDPQVAVHAIRNLSRIAFGAASLRWSQLGFGRTSSTSTAQQTPRNLFGFKDGTANLKAEEAEAVAEHLWVAAGDDPEADWLAGGAFLVARRINMHIETWDRTSLQEQEGLMGRDRKEGAPLSGGTEFTAPNFALAGSGNAPVIPLNSHLRLAHPEQNQGHRILRRGYNFADGNNELGRLDAGLFFVAFMRNPTTQYIPMQNRLSLHDGLMEYLQHTGSGLWACPGGIGSGEYVGQRLFES